MKFIRKIGYKVLFLILPLTTISCSKEELVYFETYDKIFEFQLSNRFEIYKHAPDLNFFENGKYRIELSIDNKPNEHLQKMYEEFRLDKTKTYRNFYFMTFNQMDSPIQNDYNYPILAFSGKGKDKSIIVPVFFEGYFFMVETPNHFVQITLKHTANFPNSMNKEEALKYIKPLLKSFKEK